jgi:hypothetical protein
MASVISYTKADFASKTGQKPFCVQLDLGI